MVLIANTMPENPVDLLVRHTFNLALKDIDPPYCKVNLTLDRF